MNFWPFLKKGARHLSKELREELLSKFGVGSEASDAMRYVSKRGMYSRQPVNLVCIFDPATVADAETAACTYDGMIDQKEGVLFTGHILSGSYETRGKAQIHMQDLRPS